MSESLDFLDEIRDEILVRQGGHYIAEEDLNDREKEIYREHSYNAWEGLDSDEIFRREYQNSLLGHTYHLSNRRDEFYDYLRNRGLIS
ncbi:MAG: hypothetical protein ABEK17_03790 [Candidatus Aenigmatarchaeota archaeon]